MVNHAMKNKMAKLLNLNYSVELGRGCTSKMERGKLRRREQYYARRNREYIMHNEEDGSMSDTSALINA